MIIPKNTFIYWQQIHPSFNFLSCRQNDLFWIWDAILSINVASIVSVACIQLFQFNLQIQGLVKLCSRLFDLNNFIFQYGLASIFTIDRFLFNQWKPFFDWAETVTSQNVRSFIDSILIVNLSDIPFIFQ